MSIRRRISKLGYIALLNGLTVSICFLVLLIPSYIITKISPVKSNSFRLTDHLGVPIIKRDSVVQGSLFYSIGASPRPFPFLFHLGALHYLTQTKEEE
jgi:hypothetical protein